MIPRAHPSPAAWRLPLGMFTPGHEKRMFDAVVDEYSLKAITEEILDNDLMQVAQLKQLWREKAVKEGHVDDQGNPLEPGPEVIAVPGGWTLFRPRSSSTDPSLVTSSRSTAHTLRGVLLRPCCDSRCPFRRERLASPRPISTAHRIFTRR